MCVGREVGNSAVAASSGHVDTAIETSAVGSVDAAIGTEVYAVDERDVVPESVGNGVLELRDAVGPHEGRVFGDLERLVAVEALRPGTSSRDGGLSVGSSAPVSVVSVVRCSGWIVPNSQDGDIVATRVVDDGVTGESGGNEGLERDGAEKATREHCFKRV